MFTDQPVTPVRLEVLLDLLRRYSSGLKREVIYELLQPQPLCDDPKKTTSLQTVGAALQLDLAEEKQNVITLNKHFDKNKSIKENILRAVDRMVLSSLEIELYLSLYYAYYLGLDKKVYDRLGFSRDKWVEQFNKDVFNNEPQSNPFNATKHTGLDRWFSYFGLGWYDSNDQFQANPYERLLRSLPDIFRGESELYGDQFMKQLSEVCPELDGGEIFLKANKYRGYNPEDKQCTLGLSHAFVELHEDKIITLECPVDSRGWSIELAMPSRDDTIKQDRITLIKYLGK